MTGRSGTPTATPRKPSSRRLSTPRNGAGSEAAKKAAITRRKRTDKRIYEAARRIVDGHLFGPSDNCFICGKGLGDPDSKERGIGSDCWQSILDCIKTAS